MLIHSALLSVLCCPRCHGELMVSEAAGALQCTCNRRYLYGQIDFRSSPFGYDGKYIVVHYLHEGYRVLKPDGIFILNTSRTGCVESYRRSIWFWLPYMARARTAWKRVLNHKGLRSLQSPQGWSTFHPMRIGCTISLRRSDSRFSFARALITTSSTSQLPFGEGLRIYSSIHESMATVLSSFVARP